MVIAMKLKSTLVIASVALAGCGVGSLNVPAPASNPPPSGCAAADGSQWLSAWGGVLETGTAPVETTVRNVGRITMDGARIRLRFWNPDESLPLVIGRAYVGIRDGDVGANIAPGTNTPVTFGCQTATVIPPGTESFYSDPVDLPVEAMDDVAVSLYIPGDAAPPVFTSSWNESYALPGNSGDRAEDESGSGFERIDGSAFQPPIGVPLLCNGCQAYALRDIEVVTESARGAIVLLGSSSLHGYNTTPNSFLRVGEQIAARINAEIPSGERKSIVHRGIGADTLEAAYRTRMERDVWSTAGVTDVVVWVTNDLSSRSAEEIITDYRSLIADAHARDVSVICPTWVPGAQSGPANFNGERDALNDWILSSGECDAFVDWGRQIENPLLPGTYSPIYLSDGIHTNDAGHTLWADSTPIEEWMQLGR
jgi:lysophospholipase L1-like esterase